jgi:diguanylate cyclase (GGDEF)-like protein
MRHENDIRPDAETDRGPEAEKRTRAGTDRGLALQIMDALEQGVVIWSQDGICQMCNQRAVALLEMRRSGLRTGTVLDVFLTQAQERGELSAAQLKESLELFALGQPFQFEFKLASDRVLSTNVRPVRGGGHIMAISDVTEERKALTALAVAEVEAEEAQRKATEVLEDERARQREVSLLSQMDEWLQSCKSLNELYEIVTVFMQKVLPGTRGQLFIYSNSRDVLDLACAWHFAEAPEHVTPDSCWALRRGRNYTFDPQGLSFVCDHVKESLGAGEVPFTFTCLPIMAHGDTVGLIHIEFLEDGINPDVLDTKAFTKRCAEHISMAIANVKLRDELQDQSTRDPLTGLYNRRFFLNALRREMNQTASRQGNFALLSLDADKFKIFNDEHGHDAGDVVLEAIAERMCELDVDDAVACRIGGEEFSVILPNADRTRATAIAEDLRRAVAETRVDYIGGDLPAVTVSIGVAVYPTHGTEPKELIKQADVALYDAKKAGRDRWHLADGANLITFD